MTALEDRETLFRYRLEQAEETLEDAKKMLSAGLSPRSITNRAYYAIFYAVLALFLKADVQIKSSKHSGVSNTQHTTLPMSQSTEPAVVAGYESTYQLINQSTVLMSQSPNKPISQSPSRNVTYVLVTPARNEEAFIELTIESVVGQTIRPLRWVALNQPISLSANQLFRPMALTK